MRPPQRTGRGLFGGGPARPLFDPASQRSEPESQPKPVAEAPPEPDVEEVQEESVEAASIPQEEDRPAATAEPDPEPQVSAPQAKRKGRGVTHKEPIFKSPITFTLQNITFLDQLSIEVRRNTGFALDRGKMIRAFLTALEESGLDLSHVSSEKEITRILTKKLGRR